ncbi:MAG: hypothetical protein KF849_16040 [Rhizobiaceae bacterium]|nr:hypothetical protein [Rhizobiaceae bacterium]
MHEIDSGFRLDGRLIPWGTTMASAAADAGIAFADDGRVAYTRLRARCPRAYGFDTLAAEMGGFGGDRPVTSLAYELALPGDGSMDAARWIDPIRHACGVPERDETEEIAAGDAYASSRVRRYAHWQAGEASIGISIYGAPRSGPEGRSAGTLWLSWPHAKAAIPYLPPWRSACAALAVSARGARDLRAFTVQMKPSAMHLGSGRNAAHNRACELALTAPDVLDTPLGIATRLKPDQFAFWRNPDQKLACLSTRFDSRIWDEGSAVEVTHQVTRPAKGGGMAGLHLGRLSIYDFFGSRAIAEAADALAQMTGVTVKRVEDYDC